MSKDGKSSGVQSAGKGSTTAGRDLKQGTSETKVKGKTINLGDGDVINAGRRITSK